MTSGEAAGFETYDFSPRQARWVRVECFGTTRSAWNLLKAIEACEANDSGATPGALGRCRRGTGARPGRPQPRTGTGATFE